MPVEGPFILVNPDRCLGCHTCELACAVAHTEADSLIGAVLAGERLQPRNHVIQWIASKYPPNAASARMPRASRSAPPEPPTAPRPTRRWISGCASAAGCV